MSHTSPGKKMWRIYLYMIYHDVCWQTRSSCYCRSVDHMKKCLELAYFLKTTIYIFWRIVSQVMVNLLYLSWLLTWWILMSMLTYPNTSKPFLWIIFHNALWNPFRFFSSDNKTIPKTRPFKHAQYHNRLCYCKA